MGSYGALVSFNKIEPPPEEEEDTVSGQQVQEVQPQTAAEPDTAEQHVKSPDDSSPLPPPPPPPAQTDPGLENSTGHRDTLFYSDQEEEEFVAEPLTIEQIGQQLSQHVVGMNPQSVGSKDTKDAKEKETQMIHQEFLLDSDLTVGQFLKLNHVELKNFIRFKCGEPLPTDEDD